jgi:hypothetical protein
MAIASSKWYIYTDQKSMQQLLLVLWVYCDRPSPQAQQNTSLLYIETDAKSTGKNLWECLVK